MQFDEQDSMREFGFNCEGSEIFGFNGAVSKVIGVVNVPLQVGQWKSVLSFKVTEHSTKQFWDIQA